MKTKFKGILTLLLAFVVQITFAQDQTVSGTVVDENNLPLPGATVIVKGTTNGTSTDFDGNYSIKANNGDTLEFSYVGYATQSIAVTGSSLNATMAPDNSLEEVIVVGYGSKKRSQLTSAVANVTESDLQKIAPTVSVDQMLQGVASGVQVTAQNGKPGQTAFVRVRGIGSINAGNQPLYILDGAPINEADVSGINPNDIASVSVLKDAASTSIYGARGSNGVVLITTKRGKEGKGAQIKFSSRVGFSKRIKDNFEMMNAEQKLRYERELGIGLGASISSNDEWQRYIDRDTNWEDELLQEGFIQSVGVSITGGDEKTRYFTSLGYDADTGIIRDIEAYNRVSGRLNVDYDAKKWLTVGTSLSFSGSETGDPRDRNNVQNPIRAMYDYNPYETFYIVDNNNELVLDANGNPQLNPTSAGYPVSAELRGNLTNRFNNRFFGNMYLDFQLTKGLKYKSQVSGSYDQYRRENFLKPGSRLDLIINGGDPTGNRTDNGSFDFTYNWLNKLTYTTTLNDKHNIEATVFSEYIKNNFRSYSARGEGFVVGGPSVLDVAATPDAVGGNRSEYSLFSLVGSVDYNYDDRYILTGTIRRDGSSRFGANTKYGNFFSGSVAWNISNEEFFNVPTINNLKLRAAAGTSGNDQIGRYASKTLYGFGAYNNGSNTISPSNFGDPNLGWEKNFNYGIGLEFALLDNRVRGLVDYYNRTTSDLLLNQQTSLFTGGNVITGNLGEMVNKGWEFELSGDVVRNDKLKITLNANLNLYDNEVTKLVTDDDLFTASNYYTILRVGEEVNSYYLTRYAGVNPANGQALYYDTDGNITTNSSGNEVVLSGKSPFADFDGSFGAQIEYHNFDLSANFYYKVGNYIYNIMEQNMLSDGDNAVNNNQRLDAFNYWRNPGDTNVLPNPLVAGNNQDSDRFLQKGDYIRLRSLQLGYNLPTKFTDKLPIDDLRIYASGTNLWTYAPYYKGDPEVGIGSGETQGNDVVSGEFSLYSYPTTRTISLGVDVKF